MNEFKLANYLKINDLRLANDEEIRKYKIIPGYASYMGINLEKIRFIIDNSIIYSYNLVIGANEENYHYINYNYQRDSKFQGEIIDISAVKEGDLCPKSKKPLQKIKGIEIGNIFELGQKYTKSLNVKFLNKNGKEDIPYMGCYGIGIERLISSAIEQSNDKFGPIWHKNIAPFSVHLIILNKNKENIVQLGDELYQFFLDSNIEVLYDDRNIQAGYAFNDADLIGIPYRLVLSIKTLQENKIEFSTRDKKIKKLIDLDEIKEFILKTIFSKE